MNRLRNIVGLIAVCATAAFFTGCGEDDHADNGTPQANAPASLAGRTYNLADAGGTSVIAFDQNSNYTLTPSGGGQVETGTATSNQAGDVWTSSLVATGAATNSTLTLTFNAPGSGTYTFDRPGEALVSGNFQEQTGTTNGNTTTDGGTTTNGGTGSVPAPATLQTITITPANGIAANQTFTVTLQPSGTFQAVGTQGQDMGSGTYTYQPNGTTANLHLLYGGTSAGDFDDYNLVFTQTQGSGAANNFTGTQRVSGTDSPINGTFTY
jgi:hypothetical protein